MKNPIVLYIIRSVTEFYRTPHINHVIALERWDAFNLSSDLAEYQKQFQGIQGFLHYVRLYPSSKTVLDLCAGDGNAINELASHELGRGLQPLATGLLAGSNMHLEGVPYIETPAETLNGIEDQSIGGILANYSITYSNEPEKVVDSVDRVLVSGGLIKSTFHELLRYGMLPVSHTYNFAPLFEAKGYDVATHDNVLYAKKPGLETRFSTQQLLKLDRALYI